MINLRLLWKKTPYPPGKSFEDLLAFIDKESRINANYYGWVTVIAVAGLVFWAALLLWQLKHGHPDWSALVEKTFPSVVWSSMVGAFSLIARERHRRQVFEIIRDVFPRVGGKKEQESLLEQMRETVWAEFFKGEDDFIEQFLKGPKNEGD